MNWGFAAKSYFLILISFQPDGVTLRYFKLWIFDLAEFIVWNIKDLRHWVLEIKGFKSQCVAKTNSVPFRFVANSGVSAGNGLKSLI